MSAVSFRSAVATGLVAKPAARDVKARAGLKVYARMTKDRVSLKKDSKWRSDIDIYPVRPGGAARPVSLCLVTRGGTERARHTPPRRSRPQPRRTPRARSARAARPRAKKASHGGWRDRVAAGFFSGCSPSWVANGRVPPSRNEKAKN